MANAFESLSKGRRRTQDGYAQKSALDYHQVQDLRGSPASLLYKDEATGMQKHIILINWQVYTCKAQ
jgi:hypothetical protein